MSEVRNLKSYPPVFRQQYTGIQQNTGLDDTPTQIQEAVDDDAIPVLDFQCLNLGKLREACEDWGFFRLVNHGVPLTLMSQLRDHARNLFSHTFESKQELFTKPMSYFWGTTALTPTGAALSIGSQNINWVEGFNIPLSQLSQFQNENETLVSFRILLEEYGSHLARLATAIFGAMAENLHLDPELSKTYISESTGFVRVYRYPQCSMENEAWGINVHTDSSVLSVLNQDQVAGLQVLKDDNWLQVKPIPDTLIFNLGDMMQAISDDKYKSVKHRVKSNKEKERFSICYFVFPAEGSVIQSSKYRPFTYSDFQAQVQQDVKTLGFKVGLERFRVAG
uniref:Fe2OG dioxygenase domain-containing protein n=1 Tax=Salix viminalis TaxID=40686 RepID=A0A6N2MBJ9_SALVM